MGVGASSFVTSAPNRASIVPIVGPAMTLARSKIRTPSSSAQPLLSESPPKDAHDEADDAGAVDPLDPSAGFGSRSGNRPLEPSHVKATSGRLRAGSSRSASPDKLTSSKTHTGGPGRTRPLPSKTERPESTACVDCSHSVVVRCAAPGTPASPKSFSHSKAVLFRKARRMSARNFGAQSSPTWPAPKPCTFASASSLLAYGCAVGTPNAHASSSRPKTCRARSWCRM
mmetsp:Transcript_60406/g.174296  ORF Transcript_60406/g.174296 Transcript_60406/m.174296 type:complete len:228 (+) Transcript_60406:1578-2261(+)